MPTAILDLEATELPSTVSIDARYSHAFVLFRWRGNTVAHATLPIRSGRLLRADLTEAVSREGAVAILKLELQRFLAEPVREVAKGAPATVAICTRDRLDDLARCLESLDHLPDDGQEILVIDSASRDRVAVQDLVARHRQARVLRLDLPGLNRARNAALRAAAHDIVAFTDDDAVPDPGWLRALIRNFDQPRTLCVTGLTLPAELETEAQEVFERTNGFSRGHARRVFDGVKVNPFDVARVGAGVNMAVRRSMVEQVGAFDEALDAGTATRSGGDHDMFARILAAGYVIVYEPAAMSRHRHRRSWQELRDALDGYGTGVLAYLTAHALRGDVGAALVGARWIASQLLDLAGRTKGQVHPLPRDLALAQLAGSMRGPFAYFKSRRALSTARRAELATVRT